MNIFEIRLSVSSSSSNGPKLVTAGVHGPSALLWLPSCCAYWATTGSFVEGLYLDVHRTGQCTGNGTSMTWCKATPSRIKCRAKVPKRMAIYDGHSPTDRQTLSRLSTHWEFNTYICMYSDSTLHTSHVYSRFLSLCSWSRGQFNEGRLITFPFVDLFVIGAFGSRQPSVPSRPVDTAKGRNIFLIPSALTS